MHFEIVMKLDGGVDFVLCKCDSLQAVWGVFEALMRDGSKGLDVLTIRRVHLPLL